MTSSRSTGRPPKGDETRKAVTLRLQPSAAAFLKQWAANLGCSQSDIVEDWLDEMRFPS